MIKKLPSLLRSKLNGLNDGPIEYQLDIHGFYRRQEFIKLFGKIDDYIKSRLLLARLLALRKYNQKWA